MNHDIYPVDLPLVIVIVSLVYSATRSDEWPAIWREAIRWMIRLTAFLGIIGLLLFLLPFLVAFIFNHPALSICLLVIFGLVLFLVLATRL